MTDRRQIERAMEIKARMLAEFEEQISGVKRHGEGVIRRRPGYNLYSVTHQGQTPKELSGWYTSFTAAEQAILEYEKKKTVRKDQGSHSECQKTKGKSDE